MRLMSIVTASVVLGATTGLSSTRASAQDCAAGGVAIPICDYTYAPFGDCTATGSLAESNPWRFSSEYADDELGCVYYNYRHYEPMMGRWLSRDNVGEWLRQKDCYLLCQNSSIYFVDRLGLLVYPQFGANRGDGLSVFDLIRLYLEILNDVKKCLSGYNRAIERRDRGCNDKFNHCVTSCELGYNCGSKIAYLAGVEKELRDLFFGDVEYAVEFWGLFFGFAEDDVRDVVDSWHEKLQGGTEEESMKDFMADFYGLQCHENKEDCVCCCKKQYSEY